MIRSGLRLNLSGKWEVGMRSPEDLRATHSNHRLWFHAIVDKCPKQFDTNFTWPRPISVAHTNYSSWCSYKAIHV